MAVYDVFLNNRQPKFAKELLINNAQRLIEFVFDKYKFPKDGSAKILEIGPGKGYFCNAVYRGGYGKYYAMDRNRKALENLGIEKDCIIESSLPDIPVDKKFDVVFVGFVIEHLSNGIELYETLNNLRNVLKDDGVLILQFPDCMKLGMEFYNIDYTHSLPTTKRNVNQAVIDVGMQVDKCVDISGILYTRIVDSKFLYFLRRMATACYSYRFFSILFKLFYRTPLWSLQNVFWRAYALLKEPNVMFFIKNENGQIFPI